MMGRSEEDFDFGGVKVHKEQVVFRTRHSIVFVNHRPFVAGHLLVSPLRRVERISGMTEEEFVDLSDCIKALTEGYGDEYECFGLAIQDGEAAGQTVSHVHAHFVPRNSTSAPFPTRKQMKLEEMKAEATEHFKVVSAAFQRNSQMQREPN